MKAKMHIESVSIPNIKIQPYGGRGSSPAGHNFVFAARVRVTPRTLGTLSGADIDCPELEWKERIEWFDHKPATGWYYVGDNSKDMYAFNKTSATFGSWHTVRYLGAKYPPNGPCPGLQSASDDRAAGNWIAEHGLTWTIEIRDVPGMGLAGGSGGGGGASLVVGPSRRRVIYFDLGFSGGGPRVQCVQILETEGGVLKIHKFVNQPLAKHIVDNPVHLARWRAQVNSPNDYLP
ncbi:MAG TPA: hypothetical protein VMU00_12770 [Steroidobacteraceae bacterium]|nr:hypothetical protein [Steroidobacteraceae bacterium]